MRKYFKLTKPGIILGNLFTALGGFFLGTHHKDINIYCLFATLLGLAFIIASACVCNNIIDRNHDQKMQRTKNRPLAQKNLAVQHALVFASILLLLGTLILLGLTNLITTLTALVGFVIYVFFYSLSKYRTVHATLIGSIAGAIPALVGFSAAGSIYSTSALLFFLMIVLWQMPHFFAIALYRIEDYQAASIPVMPIKRGILWTKIQMLAYIAAFIVVAAMLYHNYQPGIFYALAVFPLSLAWLFIGMRGIKTPDVRPWARKMFVYSLVIITSLSLSIVSAHSRIF